MVAGAELFFSATLKETPYVEMLRPMLL